MTALLHDLRFGVRMVLRRPVLSGIAVLALGIGIGLTTTMFSIVQGVILRGLPFKDPQQLLQLRRTNLPRGIPAMDVTIHDFVDWRAEQTSFEDIAAFYTSTVNVSSAGGQPERYAGAFVTANTFALLRSQPTLGRTFRKDEDHASAAAVVIIGYAMWRDRFDSDPEVLGQVIRANGQPMTVIGIMPERFAFPATEDLWMPLRADPLATQRGEGRTYQVFGRLNDGVSLNDAQAEFAGIATRLGRAHPETNQGVGVVIRPYTEAFLGPEASAILFTLLGAVLGVLLIACANVANLLLARAMLRTKELAVRSALGAGRLRVVSQLVAEALVLASMGGLLGLAIAQGGITLFNNAIVDTNPPFWVDIKIDPTVVVFVVGLIVLVTLAAGIVPAMRAGRADVNDILKEESRGSASLRLGRFSKALVVVELALSLALLTIAGLMIQTVVNLKTIDFAFPTEDVLTARMTLFETDYPDEDNLQRFWDHVTTRLEGKPGIGTVGLTSNLPARGAGRSAFAVEGRSYPSDRDYPLARRVVVTAGFFETFGASIREGREFRSTDTGDTMPVAIVNERFVRRFFAGERALGKRIRLGRADTNQPWLTIVGVVPDLWPAGIEDTDHEGIYVPLAQNVRRSMSLAIRSQGAPLSLTSLVRSEVQAIDPNLPIYRVSSLAEAITDSTWPYRVLGTLSIVFGFAALLLAVIGLYGVMAFSAGQRTKEIGLRMALGAQAGDVLKLVLKQGVAQLGIGVILGLGLAAGLSRLVQPMLVQVEPWDPVVFAAIVVTLVLTGVVACFVPARRATRVDPTVALRYE